MTGEYGYEVIIDELAKAARIADAAGDYVGGIDLTGALDEIKTALPGSTSACRADTLADSWHDDIAQWRDDVNDHAHKLSDAAQLYRSNDEAAQQSLRPSNYGIEAH